MWCMAVTMALDAHCPPRATKPLDTSEYDAPIPPNDLGTNAERRPSDLSAPMVSAGNLPCRSTSSAAGAATRSAMRAIMSATPAGSATEVVSWTVLVMFRSPALHFGDTGPDGGDRFERGLPKHPFGELDVEGVLERQHHVHAGVGGHPGGEEIGVLVDGAGIHGQAAVLGQHLSNGLVHG